MSSKNWLVVGTRKKGYEKLVEDELTFHLVQSRRILGEDFNPTIISGHCRDSADEYAEDWASKNGVPVKLFPGTEGNYLYRNIEMVKACDILIAFWDGFSYGTAQAIATATMSEKLCFVYHLPKQKKLPWDDGLTSSVSPQPKQKCGEDCTPSMGDGSFYFCELDKGHEGSHSYTHDSKGKYVFKDPHKKKETVKEPNSDTDFFEIMGYPPFKWSGRSEKEIKERIQELEEAQASCASYEYQEAGITQLKWVLSKEKNQEDEE